MKKYIVKVQSNRQRADIFLATKYPRFARSALSGLFGLGYVTSNGSPLKPGNKVRQGQVVEVFDQILYSEPKTVKLPVVYEDEDVIVLNKPAGVLTHSKGALNEEATVASFIKPKIDPAMGGNRAGIVHRLDRATSGLIITAKNPRAMAWLQKQFSNRKTSKTYQAIVEGVPTPGAAIIDAPIERNPKKPQTFRVASGGKAAQTKYKVLKTHSLNKEILDLLSISNGANKSYSLIELQPVTGRTHQLRVHLKYIGHPIVGDSLYGHGADHMLLHAHKLKLSLPSGSQHSFSAPPPAYFKEFRQ